MESLPEAVLVKILAYIPVVELIVVCRLVCRQWKETVDGPAVWVLKCQQDGFACDSLEKQPEDWQVFYFLNAKKRNLIQNPCGQDGLESWQITENGGDMWKVLELPGDCGREFPNKTASQCFVASYEWCKKYQLVDLLAAGYWEEMLDTVQPDIVIKDWYAARSDCGCVYLLSVQLLSDTENVIQEFLPEEIVINQFSDANWHEISHTFSKYGPGVRYIKFEHGGKDNQFWNGWFGPRITNSTILVEP
ncbi:F-box only protein 2 [Latimeria chalumnae]|uniref:F-box protein 2 n=1 Tax=Latimeria chalumnae TaxID=7897 RepID=H3AA78_LATCH|nr:PREDICTED: F-box only protein 2 [Latimeria chalumnae]XP_006004333.1 PREDICTED: F-box only protein 2 [Latimeria chalumnae]|eukprot:XP_006004332.1 PREDICTED: F-box only protein 2 [Latimeria chalumnae]